MMRKTVSRLLALVLVLCMVVLCVPVRAYAEEIARPEGMTDEEWEAYLLRRKQLLAAADTEVPKDTGVTETVPPQSVTVQVPVDQDVVVEDNTATTIETETVVDEGGTPATDPVTGEEQTVDVTVEDTYTVEAKITDVETDGDTITEIEYEISLDKTTEKTTEDGTPVSTETTPDVDLEAKKEAEDNGTPAPEYKVEMSVNGMDAEKITRVTHTKKSTSTSGTPAPSEDTEDEVEYFYNAANGTEDTSKKYFTVEEKVREEKDTEGNIVNTVKEKVVSLWTSFLGIFHITTDAFEGSAKDENGIVKTYDNLTEAAAKNSGNTVEMLRDYNTNTTATISNGVTVDLNDHAYVNDGDNAAIAVNGTGSTVTIEHGIIGSNGKGVQVGGNNNKFSLNDVILCPNHANKAPGTDTDGISIDGSDNTVSLYESVIIGDNSKYGIRDTNADSTNTVDITDSWVVGQTGVGLKNTNATISGTYVTGTTGPAVEVTDNNKNNNKVIITSGWFDSGKSANDIYTEGKGDTASVTVKGGKFNDPDGLYSYIPKGHALISHNDGSYYVYEVVSTGYTPSRDGYRFLGYTDANGKAITLAQAFDRGVIAYAQWKAIPEKTAKPATVTDLIKAKTDEKGCTTKVTAKGDTAYVTVKDKDGEFAPISEVKISSVKQLQNLKIDTIEIQVDEDVTLVLDIEKDKKNGFADAIEVTLEKDTLMITSGEDTCIELDIAVLKASDKPVEIQLVEGELTVMLGKSSSLSVDLTKALKTGERIVVKLESGVLKLYDKYNKPIEEK